MKVIKPLIKGVSKNLTVHLRRGFIVLSSKIGYSCDNIM
jgi:hypothetical protein